MTILLIFLIILAAICYSVLIHKRAPEKKWDWWNTFAATLISVVAALVVGLILYDQQVRSTALTEQKQLSKLLQSELSHNYRMLQGGSPMTITVGNSNFPVYMSYVQPLVLEKAALSGLFETIDCENFLNLAGKTRMYNIKVDYVFSLLAAGNTGPQYEQQMAHATRNVEETRQAILQDYDWLARKLGFSIQLEQTEK